MANLMATFILAFSFTVFSQAAFASDIANIRFNPSSQLLNLNSPIRNNTIDTLTSPAANKALLKPPVMSGAINQQLKSALPLKSTLVKSPVITPPALNANLNNSVRRPVNPFSGVGSSAVSARSIYNNPVYNSPVRNYRNSVNSFNPYNTIIRPTMPTNNRF